MEPWIPRARDVEEAEVEAGVVVADEDEVAQETRRAMARKKNPLLVKTQQMQKQQATTTRVLLPKGEAVEGVVPVEVGVDEVAVGTIRIKIKNKTIPLRPLQRMMPKAVLLRLKILVAGKAEVDEGVAVVVEGGVVEVAAETTPKTPRHPLTLLP